MDRPDLRLSAFGHAATVVGLAVLAGLLGIAIASSAPAAGLMVSSDGLTIAALMDDVLHHPTVASWFQLPRAPGLVPDVAVYALLSLLISGWRAVSLVYAGVGMAAMVVVAGGVVAAIAGRGVIAGVAGALGVTLFAVAADLGLAETRGGGGFLFILLPVFHAGALVGALGGLLLSRHLMRRLGVTASAGLVLLAALLTLSDRMAVGLLLGPLVVGLALEAAAAPGRRGRAAEIASLALAGTALGWGADRLVFGPLLLRQPDIPISIGTQWAARFAMAADPLLWTGAALAAVVVLAPLPGLRRARPDTVFWWAAGATTSLGVLALTPLLYIDSSAVRYHQAAWWWAVIVVAALLVRAPLGRRVIAGLAVLGAAGLALWPDVGRPRRILDWADPMAACLTRLRDEGALHDGVAGYWTARAVEASTDWALHVAQIDDTGRVFLWGNNRLWYGSTRSGAPPVYDFVVPRGLDATRLRARFGPPDRVLPCGAESAWVYDDPARLQSHIGGLDRAADRSPVLREAIMVQPADFVTASGAPADIEQQADPAHPGLRPMTWGPYFALGRGHWLVTVGYSLVPAGAAPAAFDAVGRAGTIRLGGGALPPGQGTVSLSFDLSADLPQFELRTLLPPGDRLRLLEVRLQPAPASPATR